MIAQGYDLTKNAYHNRFQPYVAYWGVAWTLFFIFVNGYAVFWDFNATDFLTACMYILYVSFPLSTADCDSYPCQTSISLYLWSYTLATKLSCAPKFGNLQKWTLSLSVWIR